MGVTIEEFAHEVGPVEAGAVWVQGHQSRSRPWTEVRRVSAPAGIMSLRADEMIVECGAGTPIDDVQSAAAEVGQYVNLPVKSSGSGTVGGALAMGDNDLRRLGRGSIRDAVLRLRMVGHNGEVIVAGGSTVKNVSGFDLCRLFVGSRGSLGFMGDVLLRTRPLPQYSAWFEVQVTAYSELMSITKCLYRPAALLWNGKTAVFCLEGHPADVAAALADVRIHTGFELQQRVTPDLSDYPYRSSMSPSLIPEVVAQSTSRCWAEIGVGNVHFSDIQPVKDRLPGVLAITERLMARFNPSGRLNLGQGPSDHHHERFR
jgi:glycolate oxidase FAD binding subunit